MSINAWSLVRFVHVVAAMMWVGGQLMLSGVVLPVVRAQLSPETRGPIIHATARRFAMLSNTVVLPLSLITGLALAYHRGVDMGTFNSPGYGRLLTIKLTLVVVSIVLAIAHGVIATRQPKAARPAAIAGLASSLAIVMFATALVP